MPRRIRADVSREEDIVRLFAEADAQLGKLDVLVVNSGVNGKPYRLADAPAAQIREVIDVNVTGAMLCAREGVRRMSTRHGGKGGSIVLVSSRATEYGSPGEFVWYAASKGAINAFCVGLAREVGREGIRVNAVSPGPIDTEMLSEGRRATHQRRGADGARRQAGGSRRGHPVPRVAGRCLHHRRKPVGVGRPLSSDSAREPDRRLHHAALQASDS